MSAYPKTKRAQQIITLIKESKMFNEKIIVYPTELAKEIGTSAAWVTRAFREMGIDVEQYWTIGRRRAYTVREPFQ
jgi:hypothetical protein